MDSLSFFYKTILGRIFLKILSTRCVSKICGSFLDSRCSFFLIKKFVKKNNINLEDFETKDIKTFNQFFRRKIKEGKRPFDYTPDKLCSPCDGLLSVWEIKKDTVFPIKQSKYSIYSLLKNDELAKEFENGIALVFRLCVNHYHRYCYADSGNKSSNFFIPGILHTVRPIALEKIPVFTENCREYTIIESKTYGKMVQMEIGAMLVGRIVNHEESGFAERGKEKGYFEYGGSTIILLLKNNVAIINDKIIKNSSYGIETSVNMGEVIGSKK